MERETFVDAINAIQKQTERDIEISKLLSKIYSNAFQGNLLPDHNIVIEALVKVLQKEMYDKGDWINYYLWELDFGRDNYRSYVRDEKNNIIPLSNANELYDLLCQCLYES